jgi:hypothetical protein
MTELESYNQILAYAGEEPISDLETASYTVNLISSQFPVIKRRILASGFSFNTDKMTLPVDGNGQVVVPSEVIKLRFQAGNDRLTVRNGKVWNNETATYHNAEVIVLATKDIDFAQIPEAFQQWVTFEVAAEFRIRLNGVDQTAVYLKQQAVRAKATALNSEPANSGGMTGWGAVVAAYGA